MLVALDGDGATTFLISVTALLPVHRRMGINPLVLPGDCGAGRRRDEPAAVGRSNRAGDERASCRRRPDFRARAAGHGRSASCGYSSSRGGSDAQSGGGWRLSRSRCPEARPEATVKGSRPRRRGARSSTSTPFSRLVVVLLLLQGLFPDWVSLPELPAPLLFMVGLCHCLADQPENGGRTTRAAGLSRRQCRAGGLDDSRGWRVYRNPERQRNDQSDGDGARVEHPAGAFALAQPDCRGSPACR